MCSFTEPRSGSGRAYDRGPLRSREPPVRPCHSGQDDHEV
jgi:hypothetical protein